MAISIGTSQAVANIPTPAQWTKPNLETAAPSVAGQPATWTGYTYGLFLRVPPLDHVNNYQHILSLTASETSETGAGDSHISIGGPGMSNDRGLRLRTRIRSGNNNDLWGGTQSEWGGTTNPVAGAPRLQPNVNYFLAFGVARDGGAWRAWRALVQATGPGAGTVWSEVMAAAVPDGSANITTSAVQFRRFGAPTSFGTIRPPVDTSIEHFGIWRHNFPFAGGVPDPAVLQGIASGALRYDAAGVRNGGTLERYWPLRDATPAGMASTVGPADPMTIANGLIDTADDIAPWASLTVRAKPRHWVVGGRGARPQVWSGTFSGTLGPLQYRYVDAAGVVVPGHDWQVATIQSRAGGEWSLTTNASPPIGRDYTFEARERDNPPRLVRAAKPFHVGTRVALLGQSQLQLGETSNMAQNAPNPGVTACVFTIARNGTRTRETGGNGTTYFRPWFSVQPLLNWWQSGSLFIEMANRWHAETGEPLGIINTAVEGTGIIEWRNNTIYRNGWRYVGDGVSMPGDTYDSNTGIQTFLALNCERDVDCWVMNWGTSIIGGNQASFVSDLEAVMVRPAGGAVPSLDALWSRSGTPPILFVPFSRHPGTNANDPTNQRNLRDTQRALGKGEGVPTTLAGRCHYLTEFHHWVMDENNGSHPANDPVPPRSVPERGRNGAARGGAVMAHALAGWFGYPVSRFGPLLVRATWADNANPAEIVIETGRQLSTRNGAALWEGQLWVREGTGGWTRCTAAAHVITLDGTKIRIRKVGGALWNADTFVDALRDYPFETFSGGPYGLEIDVDNWFDRLIYDSSTFAGTGPTSTTRTQGMGRHLVGVGGIGLAVVARANAAPRLVLRSAFSPARFGPQPVRARVNGTDPQGNPVSIIKTFDVAVTGS